MDCRNAREALIDRLVEPAAAVHADLAAHLERCAECRLEAEALGAIWTGLGRLEVTPPDAARLDEIGATLLEAAASNTRAAARSRWRAQPRAKLVGALGGALAAGFLLGFAYAQVRGAADLPAPPVRSAQPSGPAVQTSPRFLLLLHETDGATAVAPAESRARIAEYAAWARSLRDEGRLVLAEKLGDEPGAWLPAPLQETGNVVSGFFMIVAEDARDALAVARASPHLKYGGRIEIRRIEET